MDMSIPASRPCGADPKGSLSARPVGDVTLALHFDQPRDRALELEGAVPGDIDFLRRHRGGSDQQGARLIEGIDQDIEPSRLIALSGAEAWNCFENNRSKSLRDGEVVGGAERTGTEIVEGEPGNAAGAPRDGQVATLYRQRGAIASCTVGQITKGMLQSIVRRPLSERAVIGALAAQPCEPVIASTVELEDVELLFEELDERQKTLPLQAALVKLVRRVVRGCDDNPSGLEEPAKQPFENHRVGDVLDL